MDGWMDGCIHPILAVGDDQTIANAHSHQPWIHNKSRVIADRTHRNFTILPTWCPEWTCNYHPLPAVAAVEITMVVGATTLAQPLLQPRRRNTTVPTLAAILLESVKVPSKAIPPCSARRTDMLVDTAAHLERRHNRAVIMGISNSRRLSNNSSSHNNNNNNNSHRRQHNSNTCMVHMVNTLTCNTMPRRRTSTIRMSQALPSVSAPPQVSFRAVQ